MSRILQPTEVRVPCRISFARLFEPDEHGKYSCSLLIPKTDTATIFAINKAVDAAINADKGKKLGNKDGIVNKKMLKLPLHDADEEGNTYNGYKGMMFFNSSNERRPQCVDRNVAPITDPDDLYSGCYCRVMINFYAFNREGNKGIGASLGNVQKIRDGEPLDGRTNAEDDFDLFDDDEL